MKAEPSPFPGTYAGTKTSDTWSWTPLGFIGTVLCAAVLYSVLYGPELRERAHRLQAQQIHQENRTLCEKLGFKGNGQFTACADVLSEVRRLEAERLSRDLAGIL